MRVRIPLGPPIGGLFQWENPWSTPKRREFESFIPYQLRDGLMVGHLTVTQDDAGSSPAPSAMYPLV